MFLNFETKLSHSWQDLVRRRFSPKSREWRTATDLVCRRFIATRNRWIAGYRPPSVDLVHGRFIAMSVCINGQKSSQELERIQICVISYVIISVKTQTETDRYIYLHVSIPPAPPGLSEHYNAPVCQRQSVSKMCTDYIKNVSDSSTQYTGLQEVRPCGRTWGTPYHPYRSIPTGRPHPHHPPAIHLQRL